MLDLRGNLLLRVHAGDLHVAAERDRFDPVLGLAALERPDRRPEEEEEALDPHPRRLGGDEVAGLVEDDQQAEADEDEEPAHAGVNPRTWLFGAPAGLGVGGEEVVEVGDRLGRHLLQHPLDHRGDAGEGDLPVEEGGDGDLVGGVEHAGRGAAGLAGLEGQAQAGEGLEVGRLEGQLADRGEVELRHVDVGALRVVQRVGDRHPHVGIAEVGERGAVVELDQRVDQRLRVDDDVDPLVGHGEEVMRLDRLEALVHQRRRVDRDPAAHLPGRVGERVLDADARRGPRGRGRARRRRSGPASRRCPGPRRPIS